MTQPQWTPDGTAFSVSVRSDVTDSIEQVYWVIAGESPIHVATVDVLATGGSNTIPLDNNTLFYVSVGSGGWLVDVDDGVIASDTLTPLAFDPQKSALVQMTLSRTQVNNLPAIDIGWVASSYGYAGQLTAYQYLVTADGQTTYLGDPVLGCFSHSRDYNWFFAGYSSVYGTSIIHFSNRDELKSVEPDPIRTCGFNFHWDDGSQYAAYLEYTSPLSIQVEKLNSVSVSKSEMAVAGVELKLFGGMTGDGTRVRGASVHAVYAASVVEGIVGVPRVISSDLGEEEVKNLAMSPNGELAAYISMQFIDDDDAVMSGEKYNAHVDVSDLTSVSYLTGYMQEEKHNSTYPHSSLLRFTDDSANLLFVVQQIHTDGTLGMSTLYNVDVANQTLSHALSSIYNTGRPAVYF